MIAGRALLRGSFQWLGAPMFLLFVAAKFFSAPGVADWSWWWAPVLLAGPPFWALMYIAAWSAVSAAKDARRESARRQRQGCAR